MAKNQKYLTEDYYIASQWKLIRRRFLKHRTAIVGLVVLGLLYLSAVFCEFVSPYTPRIRFQEHLYTPPQRIRFVDNGKFQLRPFVYGLRGEMNPETFLTSYREIKSEKYNIRFFVRGEPYELWGIFKSDVHLFGTEGGTLFLFGTDDFGRDLLTRNLYASRVSLSVGLVGVSLSFILGCLLGGISGYFGGSVDIIIQRVIEFLLSLPTIPLWMALSAALPPRWSSIRVYFGITIILSLMGWTGLARVVRGKLLELREADFVMAASISGTPTGKIISHHLLPSVSSYLVVNLTLAVPSMILGETALSFLGLGIRPPAVSWGTLLQDSQDVMAITLYPWLFIPALFVVITVLAFNFVGDGLRDAADPYK